MFKGIFIILFFFALGHAAPLYGQKNKPRVLSHEEAKMVKKDASTLFASTDYKGALLSYAELYKVDSQNVEYNFRLGYCYLVTTVNKKAALNHLAFAVQSKEVKNEWHYYLGLAYMYHERWDDAIRELEQYKTATNSKAIKDFLPPDRLVEMCNNGKALCSHPVNCTFSNLGKTVNSSYDEYNPLISADEKTLVFTSRRKGNAGGFNEDLGMYTADVYWAQWRDSLWSRARSTGANINTNWDEETIGLSPVCDQLLIYFDNETAFGDIGYSSLKGKMWQKPVMFPAAINSKDVEGSGSLSLDGNSLIFSSNRKDGMGGKDLWMSKKENGVFGEPVNLGSEINTGYDEAYPSLSLDGKRLYFSSTGWNSMGGFDIFYSDWNENENKWSMPVNIGFPINNADDNTLISFSGDSHFAYVAAVRPEGFGERDIYRIEFLDTLHHPFTNYISAAVSSGGGRMQISKVSLLNNNTGKLLELAPPTSGNQFILPVAAGEYTFQVEAGNFKTYTDTTIVTRDFPPVPIFKKIQLQSSK